MNAKQKIIVLYLDYVNNYLTVENFALDNGLTKKEAKILINAGRKLNKN